MLFPVQVAAVPRRPAVLTPSGPSIMASAKEKSNGYHNPVLCSNLSDPCPCTPPGYCCTCDLESCTNGKCVVL